MMPIILCDTYRPRHGVLECIELLLIIEHGTCHLAIGFGLLKEALMQSHHRLLYFRQCCSHWIIYNLNDHLKFPQGLPTTFPSPLNLTPSALSSRLFSASFLPSSPFFPQLPLKPPRPPPDARIL